MEATVSITGPATEAITGAIPGAIIGLVLGLIANLVSEAFLTFDPVMHLPMQRLLPRQRQLRLLRWVIAFFGLGIVGAAPQTGRGTFGVFGASNTHDMRMPWDRLIAITLMTVTASTDFECRLLPPGWFIYSAVIFGVISPVFRAGISGVIDSAVVQALCFGLGVLFALLGQGRSTRMDPGDIRALQQLGSAAGSLSLLWIVVLGFSALYLVVHGAFTVARRKLTAIPLATVVWSGLIVMPLTPYALASALRQVLSQ